VLFCFKNYKPYLPCVHNHACTQACLHIYLHLMFPATKLSYKIQFYWFQIKNCSVIFSPASQTHLKLYLHACSPADQTLYLSMLIQIQIWPPHLGLKILFFPTKKFNIGYSGTHGISEGSRGIHARTIKVAVLLSKDISANRGQFVAWLRQNLWSQLNYISKFFSCCLCFECNKIFAILEVLKLKRSKFWISYIR